MRFAMTRLARVIAVAALGVASMAHVGNPNTLFAGRAGAYDVRVIVSPAGVVPGQARVTVHAGGATRVLVSAAPWSLGSKGAPSPDALERDATDPALFTGSLWLMTGGAYGVHVSVEGPRGTGAVVVPVNNLATRTLGMSRAMGAGLLVMAIVLVAGLVTIVRAATGEATLEPGAEPSPAVTRRSRIGMAVATVVLTLALLGGRAWWNSVEAGHRRSLYVPLTITPSVFETAGGLALRVAITDTLWTGASRRLTPMIPDHGRPMHVFLVREPALDAFAHLHPVMLDSSTFDARLPGLPPGTYRLYAGIVHASGFAQTLVSTVTLGGTPLAPIGPVAEGPVDDDGAFVGDATLLDTAALRGGERMVLDRSRPFYKGAESSIEVRVLDADGAPAMVQSYLGMAGHAAVTRPDGSLFVHLHPMGTVSAVALRRMAAREAGDTSLRAGLDDADHDAQAPTAMSGDIAFPFIFPESGRYRIWVQVKRGGSVRTAGFNVDVAERR